MDFFTLIFLACSLIVNVNAKSVGDRNMQELFGFQDIMAHLAGGYKVSFYMSGTDCNDPSSLPGEFHEPFGGNIDFYFQYKEKDIFTAQFTMSKFDRNSGATFYAFMPTKQVHRYNFIPSDVRAALIAGKQVQYSAMLFLCQGDLPWTSAGGHIRDFDIVTENSQTNLKTTFAALVRDTAAIQSEYIVVTSSLHDNRIVDFSISDNEALTFKTVYEGTKSCFMQTVMPGGTVSYFIV